MVPVQDLSQVHLSVTDLDRSIAFYREVVGLRLAHMESDRQAAFFWIGADRRSTLGLWATGSTFQRVTSHAVFRASLSDVVAAPCVLRAAGIAPLDFDGRSTDQATVLAWMPAASVFFRDPDGHLLAYTAVLPDEPRPEYGIVPWRMWELLHSATADWEVVTAAARR
jgi:lactoylglutathione lyase